MEKRIKKLQAEGTIKEEEDEEGDNNEEEKKEHKKKVEKKKLEKEVEVEEPPRAEGRLTPWLTSLQG